MSAVSNKSDRRGVDLVHAHPRVPFAAVSHDTVVARHSEHHPACEAVAINSSDDGNCSAGVVRLGIRAERRGRETYWEM